MLKTLFETICSFICVLVIMAVFAWFINARGIHLTQDCNGNLGIASTVSHISDFHGLKYRSDKTTIWTLDGCETYEEFVGFEF